MRHVILAVMAIVSATHASPAAGLPPPFVVDGSDVAVFFGETADVRFRVQNNTRADAPFTWTIVAPSFSTAGSVVVPRLKDALVADVTAPIFAFGGESYTITLTHTVTSQVLTATLDVRVVDSFDRPAIFAIEDDVIVDLPLQKPIVIRTPASPIPSLRESPERDKGALLPLPFFVTRINPDAGSPLDLFDISPTSGAIAAPPNTTVLQNVTVSLPAGGLPYGTMNTITLHIVVGGDTVLASGQAIFQGACHNSTPSCPPQLVPSLWNVSTYDDYVAPLEQRSLWCGTLNDPSFQAAPGYGSCWKASAYLRLGLQPAFTAASGMTLGGVHLYSAEKAHDLCRIDLGVGVLADTITEWKQVAVFSGISDPDSTVCPDWLTKPYLCARYTPFEVVVPGAVVPDNSTSPLWVRWRFTSDLTWDDESAVDGVDTKGAWRLDHVHVRGDLVPNSYYPPDPSRTAFEKFEISMPPFWTFPLSVVFDCTAVEEPAAPDASLPWLGASSGPIILSAQPNPTSSASLVRFAVPTRAPVVAAVCDVQGRRIREIDLGPLDRGEHAVAWDGSDGEGRAAASGVYFLRIEAGHRHAARAIVLIRR